MQLGTSYGLNLGSGCLLGYDGWCRHLNLGLWLGLYNYFDDSFLNGGFGCFSHLHLGRFGLFSRSRANLGLTFGLGVLIFVHNKFYLDFGLIITALLCRNGSCNSGGYRWYFGRTLCLTKANLLVHTTQQVQEKFSLQRVNLTTPTISQSRQLGYIFFQGIDHSFFTFYIHVWSTSES
jgi:hypothetical protein